MERYTLEDHELYRKEQDEKAAKEAEEKMAREEAEGNFTRRRALEELEESVKRRMQDRRS